MARELQPHQLIERSLIKKYRKELWNPFIEGVQRYALVQDVDRIAVVADGTAAAAMTVLLLQQLQRVSQTDFTVVPVLLQGNTQAAALAERLRLSCETVAPETANEPSALLAALSCNKLAQGTCRTDVVNEAMTAMLYRGRLEGVLPQTAVTGGSVILPLFCIGQEAIAAWVRYNALPVSETERPPENAAAQAVLRDIQKVNPDLERNVFQSLHAVCRDTLPGYIQDGQQHSFLERFDADNNKE